jgi:hypothetical protein
MTRSGPARLLGLRDRGHLGVGAAADIAVYRERADREAMFTHTRACSRTARWWRAPARITATPVGGTHFVEPGYDRGIEKTLRKHWGDTARSTSTTSTITHDELCSCCNGGRLLPAECFDRGRRERGFSMKAPQRRRDRRHLRRSLPDEGHAARHHRAQHRPGRATPPWRHRLRDLGDRLRLRGRHRARDSTPARRPTAAPASRCCCSRCRARSWPSRSSGASGNAC